MGMFLNLGNDGFQSIRKSLYVDKSGLISFMNETLGTNLKLTCVSRARRFGKSFAAKMLCAYYDKSCDSKALFEDLEIAKNPSFEKYLNQFDVIYLDMTWFISVCRNTKKIMGFLKKQVIQDIGRVYPCAEDAESLSLALAKVNEMTGNKFIIIIDEWDAFFRERKEDTALQKEYIQFLRELFKGSLTDKTIEAAYMTGILPIKKYGTQSAMTDFKEYTMLDQGRLEAYVGFTEPEVQKLCQEYDMDFENIKKWYDGYSFSRIKSVYNPNSVAEAIRCGKLGTYWTQTETYESLKIYIDMDMDGLKEAVIQMIGGVQYPVDIGTFQNDMTTIQSRDDVLTLLVHLGYLVYNADKKTVCIPNEEIRQEFIRAVKNGKHKEITDLILTSDRLLQDTLNMDAEKAAAGA